MKISQLKELVRQVVKEENDYQQLFKHMLDKTGKDINSMSDDEKKKFFNAVDTAYKAKSEGRLRGYNEAELTAGQKKLDTDKDGEIEGSDLAALRAKNEGAQKKKVDENLAIGILATLGSIIIGKIVFYYFVDLVSKGMKYFQGKSEHKNEVKAVLDSISNDKGTISDIAKMIDPKKGIDSGVVDKIVNLPYVKTQIVKMSDKTNGELSETELENQLKTIILKSWNDSSITTNAIEKVKKDIK